MIPIHTMNFMPFKGVNQVYIVTAKEMYNIDYFTMHDVGLKPVLMANAGRAVYEKRVPRITTTDKIIVLAGGVITEG